MVFSWSSLAPLEKVALSIVGELNQQEKKAVEPQHILSYAKHEGIGYRIDSAALHEVLERLFYQDILDKSTSDDYTFKMDLWRIWLSRMHSIWQVIDELKNASGELGDGIAKVQRSRTRVWVGMMALLAVIVVVAALSVNTWMGRGDAGTALATPDSAWISVQTAPPNAWVFWGRQRLGRSPIEAQRVPAGLFPLRIELDGYQDYVDSVRVDNDETVSRNIALAEQTGGLRFTSQPAGADVFLDGEHVGRTPCDVASLSVNRVRQVRFDLAGYDAFALPNVRCHADSVVGVHHAFVHSTVQTQIVTTPDGATVFVDGEPKGVTPLVVLLTHGAHDLRLERAGYVSDAREISAPAPGNNVRITLEKLPPGTLVIKAFPYADIYVAGELRKSETDRYTDATLAPGTYEIELRHPKYGVVRRVIEVPSGDQVELTINMSEEAGGP